MFSVSGTTGQLDGGGMSGGDHSEDGGFWEITAAVKRPVAPGLAIALTSKNTAMVSCPSPSTGFNLQPNSDLNTANWVAPFKTVTDDGTNKFVIVKPPAGNCLFRLFNA